MLTKLPSAWFAGLKVEKLTQEEAIVSVRYKWFNKNPFHSIYVAVLSMPSEVSTGILCMGALFKRTPAVSMLVVKNEGHYYKKAVGKIRFTCSDGAAINDAVEQAIATGEATTINCHSVGANEQDETVAEFYFTWSFKARAKV
jgi:phage terminase large subunit-like protein